MSRPDVSDIDGCTACVAYSRRFWLQPISTAEHVLGSVVTCLHSGYISPSSHHSAGLFFSASFALCFSSPWRDSLLEVSSRRFRLQARRLSHLRLLHSRSLMFRQCTPADNLSSLGIGRPPTTRTFMPRSTSSSLTADLFNLPRQATPSVNPHKRPQPRYRVPVSRRSTQCLRRTWMRRLRLGHGKRRT